MNQDEGLYSLPLKDEAAIGVELIATMMQDLEHIRSEVYKDKETNDRETRRALIIKNGNYIQTTEAQQNREHIQQLKNKWSE